MPIYARKTTRPDRCERFDWTRPLLELNSALAMTVTRSRRVCRGSLWDSQTTGWKKAAKVNCTILITFSVLLLILQGVAVSHGSAQVLFFYANDCGGGSVTNLDTALHILINIASTLVLASSNFFMQILNAPSREEVDEAHAKGSWLDIGVASPRNGLRVSRFKLACWTTLLLSSVPIHLVFNSAVFETDNRESDFHLTIAAEDFVSGGPYYPPGASLFIPGIISQDVTDRLEEYFDGILEQGKPITHPSLGSSYLALTPPPFGHQVHFADYDSSDSQAVSNITLAARMARNWTRVDANTCKNKYFFHCQGLKEYTDVVLVTKQKAWIRDDMWMLGENNSAFWDRYVPSRMPNNLFFDAQCFMRASIDLDKGLSCLTNCARVVAQAVGDDGSRDAEIAYDNDTGEKTWNFMFGETYINREYRPRYPFNHPIDGLPSDWDIASSLQSQAFNMTVDHCLAHPIQTKCKIGLSPLLLLAVTVCVIVKSATAILVTLVLCRRKQVPLVTLGDAIESFIGKPDPVTIGYCTVSQAELRKVTGSDSSVLLQEPRNWQSNATPRATALHWKVWATSYMLFLCGIATCGALFSIPYYQHDSHLSGSYLPSDENVFVGIRFPNLLVAVLAANSPQLLLSFCYLAYNDLFTRLQLAREWAQYGERFHPLRVTDPKGHQKSTYWLQLPYRYSVPLMAFSIALHWILSNSLYVFISTGGFYPSTGIGIGITATTDTSLPANTVVYVAYSLKPLLTLLILSCVSTVVPPLLSLKRLPAGMTIPGSNSFAISAACHVSRISHAVTNRLIADADSPGTSQPPSLPESGPLSGVITSTTGYTEVDGDYETVRSEHLQNTRHFQSHMIADDVNADVEDNNKKEKESIFSKLTQSKLRWGVVQMPPEWYEEYRDKGHDVGHLSFGVEEDEVRPPVEGEFYA
ncbi:hypothetical protein F5Y17DRAFT_452151 [Xylariaceae sp. FL0594]|nr:hypothetical protein F5Y17DRAFT_452151 [Xylariaceae sp. FL0594]